MELDKLSADGAISFAIATVAFIHVLFSWIVRERENFSNLPWLVTFSESGKTRLVKYIKRIHEFRFVFFFVLLAMLISTISPVSALMEIEENIISTGCENLKSKSALTNNQTITSCKEIAKTKGYSFVENTLITSKNHLLQIAVWPFIALVYGLVITSYVRWSSSASNSLTDEVIDRAINTYSIFHGLIIGFLAMFAGVIQNTIGT